jgi:hypothetical protein
VLWQVVTSGSQAVPPLHLASFRPPSQLPYNFSEPVEELELGGQFGQPEYIDRVFFKGQVKG